MSRNHPGKMAVALVFECLILIAFAAGCAANGSNAVRFPGLSEALNAQLANLRGATEPFQDYREAALAGYEVLVAHPVNANVCLAHPQLGAMGIHYLNPDLVDGSVSVDEPEVLIYEPRADGSLELVGVEYVIPFAIRGDDASAPILYGQQFRRNYTFNLWALHSWAWKDNPTGVFTDYNPDISCANVDAVE